MNAVSAFIQSHQTVILLAMGWLYSAAMSTMPPLKENAGFWGTWTYKFAQAAAANFNKHESSK